MNTLNFLEAWNALNDQQRQINLCEASVTTEDASSIISENNLEDIASIINTLKHDSTSADLDELVKLVLNKKSITLDSTSNLFNKYKDIIEEAKRAASKFTGSDYNWPYQLQLLCNAYIAENIVLTLLNQDNSKLRALLNFYIMNKYALDPTDINAAFNGVHNKIFIDNKPQENQDIDSQDIDSIKKQPAKKTKSKNNKHDINVQFNNAVDAAINSLRIEVKVVKSNPTRSRSFHNAEIIFIIALTPENNALPIYCMYKDKGAKSKKFISFNADATDIKITDDFKGNAVTYIQNYKFIKATINSTTLQSIN